MNKQHTPGPWSMRESATHVTVTNASGDAVFHDDKRIPGVTAQEAPKQEQVTEYEMTPNNIVAWAKDTGKKLRLSTYDMTGEEGWRPLVYADSKKDARL
jgi:hypothetical protein